MHRRLGVHLRRGDQRLRVRATIMKPERLIVFSRYPEPGQTKTRLASALGMEGAARLQRAMAEYVLSCARIIAAERAVGLEVHYEGGSERLMAKWLGPGLAYCPQAGGDLGARMDNGLAQAFRTGAEKAVLVGTDCPGITPTILRSAFNLLGLFDLVLGLARDGGYYLIGLRQQAPELFRHVPWGTATVASRTLEAAKDLGLRAVTVDPLVDVDRPEDLAEWAREARRTGELRAPRMSVVIPTLNEQEHLGATLDSVTRQPDIEVIVVDGGSADRTAEVALARGARLLRTTPQRARQLNAGAAAASAQALIFLHGDTRLPRGFARHALDVLAQPGTAAGAFRLTIAGEGRRLRLVETLANWRSRLLHLPYGDQALFVTAELFRQVGGFPDVPIMEDVVFTRRLRRVGRIAIAPCSALTSDRRWQRLGVLRTTLVNQVVLAGFFLGVDPARLARWYRGVARSLSAYRER
jgi:rSAM/selenodomain-associated transferase 2/rSAM/selenodomain-associated transferase 1